MQLNRIEVWAQLFLRDQDQEKLKQFFIETLGIKERFIVKNMHITVYHSRRPMPGLSEMKDDANIVVPAEDMRFMVMAPGGENPRPEFNPGKRKVGVRVHRKSIATSSIQALRNRLIAYETKKVLGNRPPSTHSNNAFGARHFQPHMSVLRAGSKVDRDLRLIGEPFRRTIGDLTFDRFEIEITSKNV